MYIHKEGHKISFITLICFVILTCIILTFAKGWVKWPLEIMVLAISFFIIRFFRMPKRELLDNPNKIIASADGTIVVVEQIFENEYLKTDCLQISTFMSPNNIHVNRYPISGRVVYTKYYDGKKLYARNPKSSFLNERTSVCIEREDGKKVLVRQIAGALARRIVCYAKEGETVKQGDELGFIKFGSRVDLLIPLDSEVHVEIEDKVKGGQSIIATI
ncbi:MAG: phosphatidylserine decarboxylase family protein [Bacteroidales bacterium]|nr:phosphatidylserine decarboxylase family protein [Bacteroidales bacterium]